MDHSTIASKMKELTLLYIEDDVEIRGYLAEFIGRYTDNLHLAQSAEEGQVLYEKWAPDIILLDINLPGKSGIDFARRLRERDTTTRIIITTAYTDKEFLLTAVELGLTRYLVKPVTSSELMYALNKAADEQRKKRKHSDREGKIDIGRGFEYSEAKKSLTKDGVGVVLRRKEMELLEFFLANRDKVVTYEALEYEVWPEKMMSRDALRAQIRNLRKKTYHEIIINITAIGYQFGKEAR